MQPRILFSKPITCHFSRIPDDFIVIGNEAEISYNNNDRQYIVADEILTNALLTNWTNNSIIVSGRLSERFIFKRRLLQKNIPLLLLDIEWHWRYRNKISIKNRK